VAAATVKSQRVCTDIANVRTMPYHRLEEILGEMPRAWKASETPDKLYLYLLAEFSE
jgi:hypothetical protein